MDSPFQERNGLANANSFRTSWRAWGLMTDACVHYNIYVKHVCGPNNDQTTHLGKTGMIFIWRLASKKDKSRCHCKEIRKTGWQFSIDKRFCLYFKRIYSSLCWYPHGLRQRYAIFHVLSECVITAGGSGSIASFSDGTQGNVACTGAVGSNGVQPPELRSKFRCIPGWKETNKS